MRGGLRGIKSLVNRVARRFGYHIVGETLLDHHAHGVYCRDLFAHLGVDCVLDVGANQGQYRRFVRDVVGFSGYGVSFEPVPHLANACREAALNDHNWKVETLALGSSEGEAHLNLMEESDFSSFLRPSTSATKEFVKSNVVVNRISVPVRRLDNVLPTLERQLGFRRPFLKVDTQGFDLEVLRGVESSLDKIVGIQTELSWVPIYDSMPRATQVIEYLEERNFRIAAMYRIGRIGYPNTMIEGDAYFVRAS